MAFFPKEFVWGAASASYQIEGGVHEGGRGPSIWDTFSHIPGKVARDENGDVAALKAMGLRGYRFSIAWPRIVPDGDGAVNEAGFAYYDALVDALLQNGIEPYVTLYHWDLPQALEDRGGWRPASRQSPRKSTTRWL